jgi:DNA processing protein
MSIMPIDEKDIFHLLLLASVPGIGHSKLRALIQKFGSAEHVFRASLLQLTSTDGFEQKTAEKILDSSKRDEAFAEDQIALIRKYKTQFISLWDPEFPENLKNIYDPPAYIYIRGTLEPADEYSVAIVGTREATPYGRHMAEVLSRELSLRGITTVSGLARGIDTIVHQASIRHGGRTLAVLGCGVDRIYPSENYKLAMEIIERGALISDYPMRTAPDAIHFPGRNRIISGLSLGTVIVEAPERSGALITAEYALEQNRELFAVPGNAVVPQAKGPNRLIRQGAKLVETVDDILSELESRLIRFRTPPVSKPAVILPETEAKVFDCISTEPIHIDEISRQARMPVSETLSRLLNLEISGMVRQLAGMHFVKIQDL